MEIEDKLMFVHNIHDDDFLLSTKIDFLEDSIVKRLIERKFELACLDENEEFKELSLEKFHYLFRLGVESILKFIQTNWLGPSSAVEDVNQVSDARHLLTIDSEEINITVKNCEYFLIARVIFDFLGEKFPMVNVITVWNLRVVYLHQVILEELSQTLFNQYEKLLKKLNLNSIKNEHHRAEILIELSHLALLYGNVTSSEGFIKEAKDLLKISTQLVGSMGVRTQHQQKSTAQMKFEISINRTEPVDLPKENHLPEIVALDDDVRLNSIKWDNDSLQNQDLTILDQSVLLTEIRYQRRAMPQDNLLHEEMMPVIDFLLTQKTGWSSRLVTLFIKSKLESTHKRTVERALTQSEELINCLSRSDPKFINRVTNFWAVAPPPLWDLQHQLADLMVSIGLVKSALDIYLKLNLWEDVIVCYTILEMRHLAAKYIQQELEVRPNVKLMCLLGDCTDDVECYQKALEMSNFKSSRPYRHWGLYLFAKKKYEECISYFQKSLEINSLQAMVWLRLGYAALSIENWELAAMAYRRYTAIEPGAFEAWNNLARIYIALGDKNRAHRALSEAIKFSYDNWQVWENLMLTSADTGHFDDIILAYHRLLDLQGKHVDVEILTILVRAILQDISDFENNSPKRLTKKCLELLGRVTSIHPNEYKIWELYALLTDDIKLKVQRLQRAYRALVQSTTWSKNLHQCSLVLNICKQLGETCVEAADISLSSSVRLSLKSAVKAAEDQDWKQHAEIITEIKGLIETLTPK